MAKVEGVVFIRRGRGDGVSFDGKCLALVGKTLRGILILSFYSGNDGRGRRRQWGPHVHADAMQH